MHNSAYPPSTSDQRIQSNASEDPSRIKRRPEKRFISQVLIVDTKGRAVDFVNTTEKSKNKDTDLCPEFQVAGHTRHGLPVQACGADVTGTCMFATLSGVHDRIVFKFHKLFLEGEWKCMCRENTVDGEAAAEVQRFTPALSVRF